MDHFRPELFVFLRDLERNNTREWFQANRERYRADVQEPLLAFIAAFATPLGRISRHFVADPRPVGGSMFRIHRDTRFARDKSPYKTHAAAQFRHREGRDVHAPGFYLHLGPDEVFIGAGLWHPDASTLAGIRAAIVDDGPGWRRASRGLELGGESLTRPPRGLDPEHPLIDDLKRKDFISMVETDEASACAAGFLGSFTESCRKSAPLARFLTRAVGLDY
jgi:uncharacterized protein (TIGR02453 family)